MICSGIALQCNLLKFYTNYQVVELQTAVHTITLHKPPDPSSESGGK